MKRLKIYYMHSNKFDFNNVIYKKILSSSVCLNHENILPLSNSYKTKYVKDLIQSADLVVVFLNNPSFSLNLELKWLLKENKKTLYLSLDDKIKRKYLKKYQNINIVNKDNFMLIIENFIKDNQNEEKYDDIQIIGKIE